MAEEKKIPAYLDLLELVEKLAHACSEAGADTDAEELGKLALEARELLY